MESQIKVYDGSNNADLCKDVPFQGLVGVRLHLGVLKTSKIYCQVGVLC